MKKYKKTISSKIRSWVAKYGGELDYEAFDSLMKILESKLALADKPKKSINILSDRNVDKLKECKHKWLYDGGLRMRCRNCGIYVDYNATPTPLKSKPEIRILTCGKCGATYWSNYKCRNLKHEVKDGTILKNGEWLENLDVSLNFYRRTGKYDKKWIARLGNPTCLKIKKIEAETLPKLLSMIEDELFAVRKSTTLNTKPEKWEKEFDNKFSEVLVCDNPDEIKDFIRSLLSTEDKIKSLDKK